jgi:hypothetical protein
MDDNKDLTPKDPSDSERVDIISLLSFQGDSFLGGIVDVYKGELVMPSPNFLTLIMEGFTKSNFL